MPFRHVITLLLTLVALVLSAFTASAQATPVAQMDIRMTHNIVAGEYVFRADGRYPSTRALIRTLRASEDTLRFAALALTTPQLNALERRATSRTPVYRTVGLTKTPPVVGVQVFRYGPRGAQAIAPTAPGTSILITRADPNAPRLGWWLVINKDDRLPDTRHGDFYGSTQVTARW